MNNDNQVDAVKPRIEIWPIDRLVPYELNSKKHEEDQVEKIASSIREFGWDQPIVVDGTGSIIKGHGRRLAAIRLGMNTVPVWVRDDLTPEQVRAARLSDNRVAISGIDNDLLKKELASLEYDLTGIFDEKELKFLDADLGEMNLDAFVDDIDEEVNKQTAESNKKVEVVDSRDVRLDKVFGFKSIKGADERVMARFIALIESETGLTGADALVAHAKKHYEGAGQ